MRKAVLKKPARCSPHRRRSGASDALFGILRDEFGYTGTTVTDAGRQPNTYMTTDLMLRKDGALILTNNGKNGLYDTESATAIYYLKDATKHILYNKTNSNIMQGIAPAHTSPTQCLLGESGYTPDGESSVD